MSRTDPRLESRLRALEEKVQSIPTDFSSQARSSFNDLPHSILPLDLESGDRRNDAPKSLEYNLQVQSEDADGSSLQQDAVDGIGAVLLTDDEEDCGYFGRQASIPRQIRHFTKWSRGVLEHRTLQARFTGCCTLD